MDERDLKALKRKGLTILRLTEDEWDSIVQTRRRGQRFSLNFPHQAARQGKRDGLVLVTTPDMLRMGGHYLDWRNVDARFAPRVRATICLLASATNDGPSVAAALIERSRRAPHRLYAIRTPFECKDMLKAAGYRWSPERRAWWIEGEPERMANEITWSEQLSPAMRPTVDSVTWLTRHALKTGADTCNSVQAVRDERTMRRWRPGVGRWASARPS